MRPSGQELTLRSALSDPLIRSLMTADKVDPLALEAMLTQLAGQVAPAPPTTSKYCLCHA